MRMLAYGCSADSLDENLRLAESTSLLCLSEFCSTVIKVFGLEYLRSPTPADMERILKHSASCGFPGMMGSLDCMHWEWKNCPYGWQGAFQNRKGTKSIILEAVATHDLWIWHAFFGMPGSDNDLNVLQRSHLFRDLLDGSSPKATFKVNGITFDQTYYLTDGIYPTWPVFVKAFSGAMEIKKQYFTSLQEALRKAIERAFGVMRSRWGILRYPSRLWHRSELHDIVMCCIILHNMIVEDEQGTVMESLTWEDAERPEVLARSRLPAGTSWRSGFPRYVAARRVMTNEAACGLLHENLVEHVWKDKRMREEAAHRQL